jgi:hypothetical protein
MPDPRQNGGSAPEGDGAGLFRTDGSGAIDPHGRAALLLVESLIHALVEKATLTRGEAIEVIDIAVDVEEELALAEHVPGSPLRKSLLAPLAASFRL